MSSVESSFILRDNASGAIRQIRRELRLLEADAKKTGKSLDRLSDSDRARGLRSTASGMKDLGRETQLTRQNIDRGERSMRAFEQRSDKVTLATRRQRVELTRLGQRADVTGKQIRDMPLLAAEERMVALARETRATGTELQRFGVTASRTRGPVVELDRQVGSLSKTSGRANLNMTALRRTVGLLKFPVAIAAVGGLTQVVGGLASGLLAVAPAAVSASGASAALIPVTAGLGVTMGTTMLATAGLSKALGGNEKAIKALTPEGRAFLELLRGMQPEVTRLQRTAQRGMFPGLTAGLGDLESAVPTLQKIIGQNSRDIGNFAAFGGRQLSAKTRGGRQELKDLQRLSDSGSRSLGNLARAGVYAGRALVSVGVAAAPLTDWLSQSTMLWARNAAETARVAEQTGRLDRFFREARKDLERFGDIGSNVFGALKGGMSAASGASDDLWDSIDHGAKSWNRWMNSVEGQSAMRRWFDDTKPALKETVGLVGDLGKMIANLSSGPEGATMLRALRDAMPAIEQGVGSLTESLGPAAIDAFGSVVNLLGDLAGEAGPLTVVAKAVGLTAEALDKLLTASGPVGPAIATAVGSFLLLKKLGVLGMIDGLRAKWMGVTAATVEAGVAARGYGAVAGGVGAAGMLPVGAAGTRAVGAGGAGAKAASGIGATEAALIAGGAGVAGVGVARYGGTTIGRQYAINRALSAEMGGGRLGALRATAADTRAMGLLGPAAGKGAAAAGRFALPIAALMGLMGGITTDGNLAQKGQGALAGATGGIISAPVSDAQKETGGGKYAARVVENLNTDNSIGAQRKTIGRLQRTIGTLPGNDSFDQGKNDLAAANKILKAELSRREDILRDSLRRQRELTASASVQHANELTDDFAAAFAIRAKKQGIEKAFDTTTKGVLGKLRSMKPAGRKVLSENMLAWAQQQARENPKLSGRVKELTADIRTSFGRMGRRVMVVNGQILDGSRTEWRNIRTALTSQTERARQDVTDDFTDIQNQAVGSLRAMGFTASKARALVAAQEKGGKAGKAAKQVTSMNAQGKAGPVKNEQLIGGSGNGKGDGIGHDKIGDGIGGGATAAAVGGSPNLMGAKAGLGVYAQDAAKYGLSVSSGARPGAITNAGNTSYHSSGDALDLAGSPEAMMRFAKHAASAYGSRLEELIYSPMGFSLKDGRKVAPYAVADHYDHVHLADTAPGGLGGGGTGMENFKMGGGSVSLTSKGSDVGGLPGATASAAGDLYAAALSSKLNDALAAAGGDTGMPGGLAGSYGPTAKGAMSFDEVARIAESVGLPGVTFAQIARGESSLDPKAIGNDPGGTQGLGLWQITTGFNDDIIKRFGGREAMFDPLINAQAAKAIYDRAGIGAWYGTKFVTDRNAHFKGDGWGANQSQQPVQWGGWNAKGGDYQVDRPTLFGAGEAGPEMVSITPKGEGGGNRIVLAPHITIQGGQASGATKAWVDKRFRQFAEALAGELDGDIEESEMELMT